MSTTSDKIIIGAVVGVVSCASAFAGYKKGQTDNEKQIQQCYIEECDLISNSQYYYGRCVRECLKIKDIKTNDRWSD